MTDNNENTLRNVYELEIRLNKLEKTIAHGFSIVADTESKINVYTNLQMVLIVIALISAFTAIVLAVVL